MSICAWAVRRIRNQLTQAYLMSTLLPPSLTSLAGIAGNVITAGDPDYDKARAVFYGGIDKHPSAIVRVTNADDVRLVIRTAQKEGRELAVRSGGHSVVGHSTTEGGLVIDLRDMAKVDVDPAARTAWIDTGATALQATEALAKHGLVIGFGDSGSVGVGGITLGGGIGFLVRRFGMTVDSVLAAEVVTSDGRIRQVDAQHEPDLFWAIRGGGGNFGVVTRIQFRLNPLPHFTGGMMVLPATPETIAGFVAASMAAPEGLSTIGNVMPAPPAPFVPPEFHGRLVIFAFMAFAGDDDAAARALEPFRSLATPIADMVKPGAYLSMYPPEDPNYRPTAVARTMFLDGIDLPAARTIHEYLSNSDATMRVAQLRVLGGAMARVPADATAFAHRSKPMLVNVAAFYAGDADRERRRAWVSGFSRALQPRDDGAYVGFLTDDGEARIRSAYPGSTWDRLARIKAKYDPTNLFRLNQNISPDSSG
jgi:FAD binding domain-containing protein/berberine-like enzyme